MSLVNPYVVVSPLTGPVEVNRGGVVVQTFGDIRIAQGYARGRWDGEQYGSGVEPSIWEIIAFARRSGMLEPSRSRVLRPIASMTWFQPAAQRVIRNEGIDPPYAIYDLAGQVVARADTQREARRICG